MKLRSRGCSRLTTSEIRRSGSRAMRSRLVASFTYGCRRTRGADIVGSPGCRGRPRLLPEPRALGLRLGAVREVEVEAGCGAPAHVEPHHLRARHQQSHASAHATAGAPNSQIARV